MKDDPADFLPLSPATLHILLALAGEDLHGYGIMQEVLRQSEGRYKLGPGTLYDNLQRLTAQGMVQEVARRGSKGLAQNGARRGPVPDPFGGARRTLCASPDLGNDDPRRKYYRLTPSGRGVLSAEISRLETVVRDGKLRMQSAKPRRA
jgi:DNA-binding PadR family transcriptional regulator